MNKPLILNKVLQVRVRQQNLVRNSPGVRLARLEVPDHGVVPTVLLKDSHSVLVAVGSNMRVSEWLRGLQNLQVNLFFLLPRFEKAEPFPPLNSLCLPELVPEYVLDWSPSRARGCADSS
jgi:hypothetical protein